MIAKCVKCGEEYQLELKERTSDFQCECGGDLRKQTFKEMYEENENNIQRIFSFNESNQPQNTFKLLLEENQQRQKIKSIPINTTHTINVNIIRYYDAFLSGKSRQERSGTANITKNKLVLIQHGRVHHKIQKEINIRYEDINTVELHKTRGINPGNIRIYTKLGMYKIEKRKSEKLEPFFKALNIKVSSARSLIQPQN